jgi:hypothetical protein
MSSADACTMLQKAKVSIKQLTSHLRIFLAVLLPIFGALYSLHVPAWFREPQSKDRRRKTIEDIKHLTEKHEVAALLGDLIHQDGAGSWPPRANHTESTWPAPLRTYKEIYDELAPLIPQATPSLDDDVNLERITAFRRRFRDLLAEKTDLTAVKEVSGYP